MNIKVPVWVAFLLKEGRDTQEATYASTTIEDLIKVPQRVRRSEGQGCNHPTCEMFLNPHEPVFLQDF